MKNSTNLLVGVLLVSAMFVVGAEQSRADEERQAEELRSWSQRINDVHERFEVLRSFENEAVLDKETQLVWQQSPDPTLRTWFAAVAFCNQLKAGDRLGWRMPTVQELATVVDPVVPPPGPKLPPGHPFSQVQPTYWSITSGTINSTLAFVVIFQLGEVGESNKFGSLPVWCVRGGLGSGVPSAQ